jgi:nicotinamidase-related amidase
MAALVSDEDSVLVAIDVQPRFLEGLEPRVAEETVDRIRWLLGLAKLLGVPVLVTEEEPDRNGGTCEAVDAAVSPDVVRHRKPAFGVAANAAIMADLQLHGRRTAVLCGLETDVCVAQSALGLRDAGWKVVVVEDAVASPGIAHEQGLARMRSAGVELVGTKGLCYEWLRTLERTHDLRDFLAAPPLGIVL